jgi:hypothetical protein
VGRTRSAAAARARLERMVECSCAILARTRPIHTVIRGAADKEVFASVLGRRLLQERLTNQTERVRRYLAEDLRPGLSVEEAGQRYCALASPELFYLLTVELGWTADQYRRWLSELLIAQLLGPADQHRPDSRISAKRSSRNSLGLTMRFRLCPPILRNGAKCCPRDAPVIHSSRQTHRRVRPHRPDQ